MNEIVKEFEIYTRRELDYCQEAENISIMHEHFKKDKNIIIR
jgi:predicted unusual protein kinase regulating ubiquinone biosynthesis (AarF/ABC1/UbiB family)